MSYTEGVSSPPIFRLWSGIACLAGAMERRIWIETARSILFPNMYIALVANPGIGKGEAIRHTEHLWYKIKRFKVAPDDVSAASLVDALEDCQQKRLFNGTELVEYSSLLIPAEEFGVFVKTHDLSFLSLLNKVWNNPRVHRDRKRHLKKEIDIPHPQINLLVGTQPNFLGATVPEEAWGMGFMARMLLIYAGEGISVPLFGERPDLSVQEKALVSGLEVISDLYGNMRWEKSAMAQIEKWRLGGFQPVPEHSKLRHYLPRRILFALKLTMIANISRSSDLIITCDDVTRGIDWLVEAEALMPDIFREMVKKSDQEVIQELHFHMMRIWTRNPKKGIHESVIYHFLGQRVMSHYVAKVFEIAVKSNVIARLAGTSDLYIPRPRTEHGLE